MAIETKVIAINDGAYVQIGASVTSLTAVSRENREFSVVAVAAGGTAPLLAETDLVTADNGKLEMSSGPADVYALATDGTDTLEIMRE